MRRVIMFLSVCVLAAILATSALAVETTPVATVVEGTITAVRVTGPNTGTITVQVPSTTSTTPVRLATFGVIDRTRLYKNGLPCELSAIAVGDLCRAMVVRTATGPVALLVYVKTPPLKWASGVIVEKSTWNGTATFKLRTSGSAVPMWFSVNSATKITVDGRTATYGQLAAGQSAEVGYVQPPPQMITVILPIPASVVNAKNPPVKWVAGTIVDKSLWNGTPTFRLQVSNSTVPMWFCVNNATTITVDGRIAPYGDLAKGQRAEVGFVQPPPQITDVVLPILASAVVAKNPPLVHVKGRLVGVDLVNGTISVASTATDQPLPVVFQITGATRIDKFGPGVRLADLVPAGPGYPGDAVDVAFMPVAEAVIRPIPAVSVVVAAESIAGVVSGVDVAGSTFSIVVPTPILGSIVPIPSLEFSVVPATRIVRGGVLIKLDDIKQGDYAAVRFYQFPFEKRASVVEVRPRLMVPIVGR